MKTKRIPLTNATLTATEGPLYRVMGEDQELHVFNTYIELRLGDNRYIAKELCVPGYGVGSEGFNYPNRNYKNQTQELLDMIFAKGSVNLSKWRKVEVPADFEMAYIEAMEYNERQEREMEGYQYNERN